MCKKQLLFNVVGSVLAVTILLNLTLVILNKSKARNLDATQRTLSVQLQPAQVVLQNLSVRLAQDAQKDPEIAKLLQKNNINIGGQRPQAAPAASQQAAPAAR
jgi:membrane protein insertase Oxa1/YidC/SpoIIIJ